MSATKAATRLVDWSDRVALRGRRRRVALIALGLVVALLVAAVVALAVSLGHDREVAASRTDGVQAARQSVESLLSYDAATIDQDQARVDTLTTGDFQRQFERVFGEVIKPSATEQRARSKATSVASGWVDATPDRVVALVFLNQVTTTAAMPGDRVDTIQARVTMTNVDGQWLVSALDQV